MYHSLVQNASPKKVEGHADAHGKYKAQVVMHIGVPTARVRGQQKIWCVIRRRTIPVSLKIFAVSGNEFAVLKRRELGQNLRKDGAFCGQCTRNSCSKGEIPCRKPCL
jgi:hypothetical protein